MSTRPSALQVPFSAEQKDGTPRRHSTGADYNEPQKSSSLHTGRVRIAGDVNVKKKRHSIDGVVVPKSHAIDAVLSSLVYPTSPAPVIIDEDEMLLAALTKVFNKKT